MEDGELEFSNNQEVFSSSDVGGGLPPSNGSIDSFFDGLIMDSHQQQQQGACTCTHTHTCCNPTGTEHTHSHTCFHVHTKTLPEDSDEKVSTDDTAESCKGDKRPLGNREAVRKYREKKKAKAASLEDECSRLRALNQQLVKRLGNQGTLEAEVSRLKCLLVDLRGRIDGEIGSFPYNQKPNIPSFSHMMSPCDDGFGGNNSQEGGGTGGSTNDQGLSGCDFDQLQCMTDHNLNGSFNSGNVSASNKRRGGHRAPKAA